MRSHKYTLLTFIIFSFATVTYAQKHPHSRQFYFRLNSTPLIPSPTQCKILKVIDTRADKGSIGYIRPGAFDTYATLITDTTLAEFLQRYYQTLAKGKGEHELLMVLYDMWVEDTPIDQEIGTFYLNADFFIGENDDYKFVRKVDSLYEAAGKDPTRALQEMARNKIEALLAHNGSAKYVDTDKSYTEAEAISKREIDKHVFSIYQTKEFKRGVYYTVEQFLQNAPSDTDFVVSDILFSIDVPRKISFYYANSKGKKGEPMIDGSFFAIYSGKQWYVSNPAMRMKFEDGEFYATRYLNGINNVSGAAIGGIFGGVGGAIIGGIATSKNGTPAWVLYKTRFDPITKQFLPIKRVNHPL